MSFFTGPVFFFITCYFLGASFAISNSKIEGLTPEGERWIYEFSQTDSVTSKKLSLDSFDSKKLIFANEKYIIIKYTTYLGVGRYKTSLFFYDAKSLVLDAVISVPNNVCAVDYSFKRNQFVLLTIGREGNPGVKWPDDTGQAIVLVDLKKKILERSPIWKRGTNLYDFGGPNLDPKWHENSVVLNSLNLTGENASFFKQSQGSLVFNKFNSRVFSDVEIKIANRTGKQLEDERNQWITNAGIEYVFDVAELHSGSSFSVIGDDSPFFAVSRKIKNSLNFTMVFSQTPRIISEVNLHSLSNRILTHDFDILDGLGVFDDGSFYARSADSVRIYPKSNSVLKRSIPNMDHQAIASFSGEKLFFASSQVNRNPAFKIFNVLSNGEVNEEYVNLDAKIIPDRFKLRESNESPEIYDFSINADRHSISLIASPEKIGEGLKFKFTDDALGPPWWEFDWSTGKLISPPYEDQSARGMFGAAARFYGSAPLNWMVVSQESSTTSGSESEISLISIDGKSTYHIGKSPYALRGQKPLVALNSIENNSIIVFSSGNQGAQVESINLKSGEITTIRKFEWQKHHGDKAFFVDGKNWVVVPCEGGYSFHGIDIKSLKCNDIAKVYLAKQNQYFLILPSGFFSGSPGSEHLLFHTLQNRRVDGGALSPWRNRPAEVLKALGGDPAQIEVLSKVTDRWLKKLGNPEHLTEPTAADLPTLDLSNDVPLWAKGESVDLQFTAKSGTAPVKEVVVRVNGVDQRRGSNSVGGKSEVTRSIKLSEGQNWIEAVAIDEKGRSSNLVRFRTILSEAAKPTKRYIIAIGVSKYRDSALNLEFAAKDATDLAAAIKESAKGETEVLLLTNEQATKDATAKIREFLANSTENDEVVAFCAGHGVLDSNLDYVYASHEFDSANPSETGIKLDELVDAIGSSKSLKRLLLLDTCHSGQVGEKDEMLLAQMNTELPKGVRAVKQRGMSVKPVAGLSAEGQQRFIEEMFLLPGIHRGINIIGASGGAEFALESAQWNNGVFTATIIEALRDKKADLNGDARISVSELRDFLGQRVSELTKGAQKPSVVAAERDQDFDLIRAAYKRPPSAQGAALNQSKPSNKTIPKSDKILEFEVALAKANSGDAYAQAVVSIYYGLGLGCDQDFAKSKEYVMLSAKQQNPLGIYRLAEMRESGEGMDQNTDQATQLMQKAKPELQELSSDPYALTALATIYERENPASPKVRELLTKASDMGYEPAQTKLSQIQTNP